MTISHKKLILFVLIIFSFTFLSRVGIKTTAQEELGTTWITGGIIDSQNQPVVRAKVTLLGGDNEQILAETVTQEDGRYTLTLPDHIPNSLQIHIERFHFNSNTLTLSKDVIENLKKGETFVVPEQHLSRKINPAFWIATIIFVIFPLRQQTRRYPVLEVWELTSAR